LAARVLLVRLRFFVTLAGVLLLVGAWPTLRAWWDGVTRKGDGPAGDLSVKLEYWCPMCPGVVSDFPGKCLVCNMGLIRRERGEPTPLPDGVVARMQFSPYRLQLAGVRTAAVEYRKLLRQIVMVGTVSRSESSAVLAEADVFEKDLPLLAGGGIVEGSTDLLPGHVPFTGEVVADPSVPAPGGRSCRVRVRMDDPARELRAGMLLTLRLQAPVVRLPWWRRAVAEEWNSRSAVETMLCSLRAPGGPAGFESLLTAALTESLAAHGMGLAVPHGAVIDHGVRKVVFVESGPGMFDAVEVTVGPRCGDLCPVLRGLQAGQRVAAAGAFLLDAEMWLNHDLAATYFGATRGPATTPVPPSSPSESTPLPPSDRILAARQKVCPVTGEPLDAMGGPVRVEVAGRTVFVCCKGCEAPLRKNPEKYLANLPAK
jgi:Cu(I)/Ag(I) efflux system membrane fusion protein